MGSLADLGRRLGEERARLGLNQQEFGGACGVTKNSQSAYETGKTPWTVEYLMRAEHVGADVSYILWGVRSDARITESESDLLECYQAAGPHERDSLLTVAGALAGRARPRRPTPAPVDPLNHIPAEALEETLFHLLDGIDAKETPAARAHLLAERLPNALSRLRDLQPVAPPVPPSPPAPPSARVAEPAMHDRGRRS